METIIPKNLEKTTKRRTKMSKTLYTVIVFDTEEKEITYINLFEHLLVAQLDMLVNLFGEGGPDNEAIYGAVIDYRTDKPVMLVNYPSIDESYKECDPDDVNMPNANSINRALSDHIRHEIDDILETISEEMRFS